MNAGWIKSMVLAAACAALAAGCAHSLPPEHSGRVFRFDTDTFAFSNETVWKYRDGRLEPGSGEAGEEAASKDGDSPYSRRCFVMSRASVQFWKFARFDPDAKPLDGAELADRIREVAGRDVWEPALPESRRVVFPGFGSLRELSGRQGEIVRDNIGLGWPIYLRMGNTCILFPPSHAHQERTNSELQQWLERRQPMVLWLCNFPSLAINHAVVVYGGAREGDRYVYRVYDPNYAARPGRLEYDPKAREFSFQKTFYFEGGRVAVRPVYLSMLQ